MGVDGDAYPNDPATTTFFAGQPIWIAIGAVTGLIVGVLKAYVFRFDDYEGFLEDLLYLGEGTKPLDCLKVSITCLVSLMGNASLGPESGLGSACTGISLLCARGVNYLCSRLDPKPEEVEDRNANAISSPLLVEEDEEENLRNASSNLGNRQPLEEEEQRRTKLMVLCRMVSAFSTILPTPAAAILLCIELPGFESLSTKHGLPYIKTVAQLTLAGTLSFWIFDTFYGDTYLPETKAVPGFLHKFTHSDLPLATGIGLMGAVLSLAYFLIAGIVKAILGRGIKPKLDTMLNKQLRILIVSTMGGTLFGLLGYIFPLTLGDGSFQVPAVIAGGGEISTAVLISSAFAKMLTYWISNECGFVGGIFFPLLLMSLLCGRAVVNEMGSAVVPTLACGLIALPAAFIPMPLTTMLLGISTFNLSSRGGIPVLVCAITAHALFAGLGVPQKLLSLGTKRNQ